MIDASRLYCKFIRVSVGALCFGVLSACSIFGSNEIDVGKTLADLPEIELPSTVDPVPITTLDKIEDSYRAALSVAETPEIRHKILVRLADLEMARSEDRQMTEVEEKEYFSEAISMYDELLLLSETQADEATDERLLYRLSKAYALDGRMDESDKALARLVSLYPSSPYAAEVEFRRAENAFSDSRYKDAEALYQQVIDAGDSTPFYMNAVYMHGWSQFKANAFRSSVKSFTEVLDRLIPVDGNLDPLSKGDRGLINDTLRVMGITFTYLDGGPSITEIYSTLGQRPYQHMLYQQVGDLYLEKERFQDAGDTYNHFIEQFPESPYGPEFAVKMIEVYKQGGFPDQVLPAKENFIVKYGIRSVFWASRSEPQKEALRVHLDSFLDELSSFYHSEGLALQTAWKEYDNKTKKGKRPKRKPAQAIPNFLKAADYYAQYIAVFPQSPKVAEMSFLMGEAYYESGALMKAVTAYETVAYDLLDTERGAKAGYSAILALDTLIARTSDPIAKSEIESHKVRSAISFADYYPSDPNAVSVLTQAAQEVFNGGNQENAVEIALRITQWQPAPAANLRKTAWLIVAHSQFDKNEFAASETSYREVLALMPVADTERPGIVERIAASMFKSAEQKVAAGELDLAITQLLSIDAVSQGSEIAIKAQYDAGNYLMDLEQWARAESVFIDFKTRFSQNVLVSTLPPKLVVIYQALEQWDKAASVLAIMARNAKTPEERRQALYLSAELYQKSGRTRDAIAKYTDYVKAYPQPFDLATEARYQLLELSKSRGDMKAYHYWLRSLISADNKAGSARTDRSRYLAAFATNYLADETFTKYERIKLTLPIKKSLKAKKKALSETLNAYKKVLAYGVPEFATEANYRIGNVYSQLSRDLLNSERPKGLDDLALEQYEILLEEQAYPFEEKSVDLLAANAERAWTGLYDKWVQKSFDELAKILPARYGKKETKEEVSDGLF